MALNAGQIDSKQAARHKNVKDQVFPSYEHITSKEIGVGAVTIKKQWRDTSAMVEISRWRERS